MSRHSTGGSTPVAFCGTFGAMADPDPYLRRFVADTALRGFDVVSTGKS
ncbi:MULTISPECIES: hypothetical protein [Sphingomonas]